MDPSDIKLSDSLDGFEGWDKRVSAPDNQEVNTAFVSLRAGGVLGVNKAADQMFGKPSAVRLMFDPERRRIGIAPTDKNDPRGWVDEWRRGGFQIPAKRFCEHYGITPAQSTRYTPKVIEGVLIIEL